MRNPRTSLIRWTVAVAAVVALGIATVSWTAETKDRTAPLGYDNTPFIPGQKWRVHDIKRSHPPVVTPAAQPGQPPSDAIVLFNGKDLSKWASRDSSGKNVSARWKLGNGCVEVASGTGDIFTREKFGDMQLHVEWASPAKIMDSGQWRGNSGIMIMGRYEIQVMDSWENPTYADGQAGAIYGQWPPLVNASRKPGEWQSYDVVWEAPRFEGRKLVKPAYVTVFHNGVLLHHRQKINGPVAHAAVKNYAAHAAVKNYAAHAAEEPLGLQDHEVEVRYRNIWVRRLKGYDEP